MDTGYISGAQQGSCHAARSTRNPVGPKTLHCIKSFVEPCRVCKQLPIVFFLIVFHGLFGWQIRDNSLQQLPFDSCGSSDSGCFGPEKDPFGDLTPMVSVFGLQAKGDRSKK